MADSPIEFTVAIGEFLKTVEGNTQQVIQKVSLDLLTSVVEKSPVDTGRFRGNWNVSIGDADLSTTDETDADGEQTIVRGSAVLAGVGAEDTVVYLTNNLPYAVPLENGHSKQAPIGMVGITVSEFQTYVDQEVRKLQK